MRKCDHLCLQVLDLSHGWAGDSTLKMHVQIFFMRKVICTHIYAQTGLSECNLISILMFLMHQSLSVAIKQQYSQSCFPMGGFGGIGIGVCTLFSFLFFLSSYRFID